MSKLTAAQTKILNAIKSGKELTTYRNHARCVFNVGTESAYTVMAKTVKPLIESGILKASKTEYGHLLTIA